ncbi:NUDIX domain-containing protein [Streptomyces sp. NPDC059862]|uniref:NUDIX hydrolase n=1 Tax=Streptomyces sp. NPDC059862 TaxID=3346975 RepID=UPI00365FEA66
MKQHLIAPRTLEAAIRDAHQARAEYDGALEWLLRPDAGMDGPLATEVWAFNRTLTHVLLVNHRWRGWVPPGGKVDPGETPREAARRELFEETGVQAELLTTPAAVTVRSYHPDWSATLGMSYVTVLDQQTQLTPEMGQPAAWQRLDEPWQGWFSEDRLRMKQCAMWLEDTERRP